jgi:hypothetical protein
MKLPTNPPQSTPQSTSPTSADSRLPEGSTNAPAPAQPTVPTLGAQRVLNELQLGLNESLLARVTDVIQRQNGGTELLLNIRGKALQVHASVGETRLQAGDWIKVLRAGNELQLMGKLAAAPEVSLAQALVQRLPWQQSLDSGLARLMAGLQQGVKANTPPGQLPSQAFSGTAAQPLPPAARQALEQLFARLPTSNQLTPGAGQQTAAVKQVQQWLSESGLFAEARLAATPSATLPDLKLAIGRVITALLAQQGQGPEQFNRLTPLTSPALIQTPLQFPGAFAVTQASIGSSAREEPPNVGQLLRILAGMLNRITVNQLHTQVLNTRGGTDAGAPTNTLLLELPWMNPQQQPKLAQLRIEQRPGKGGSGREPSRASVGEWRLVLAMDLDQAGPLQFEVSLRQQAVSALVWAEKLATLRQVHQQLPLLRSSLTDLGLEVTDLECRQGNPGPIATQLHHRLVDTKA